MERPETSAPLALCGVRCIGTSLLRERDAVSDGVGAQFLKGLLLEGRLEECQQLAAEAGVKIDWKSVMNSK